MFIAAQFTVAKFCKPPMCPSVKEWIKKLWYIFMMEYSAAERKKELVPFVAACMDQKNIILGEISQVVKNKYYVISPISGS